MSSCPAQLMREVKDDGVRYVKENDIAYPKSPSVKPLQVDVKVTLKPSDEDEKATAEAKGAGKQLLTEG